MKILGITGGVGAGKSTILDYLKSYGARVILADEVGHMVQQPGQDCYEKIVEAFGEEILKEEELACAAVGIGDGIPGSRENGLVRPIDRAKLGAIVYKDRRKLELLNGLVHPAVKAHIKAEIEKERAAGIVPFVVVEAALLLEDHYDLICDEIWYVYVEETIRCERLMASRGYSAEKVRSIMNNQMKDAEFRRRCDFVIDNSGDFEENTKEQIDKGLIKHGFL